jgi:hypothetical protein
MSENLTLAGALTRAAVELERIEPPAALRELVLDAAQPRVEAAGDDGGAFVPLVPAEHWPRAPAQAWLVSAEMPRERLAALGLPFDPARTGASLRAELLVRESGEVLAVRFVP